MSVFLYNCAIFIYRLILRFAALFDPKARSMLNGRRDWRRKLKDAFEENKHPVAWVHCASLGEFEQGRPLIEKFSQLFPKYRILLTFFSPSGYEIRKDFPGVFAVHYLPWDTADNAKFFINTVRPQVGFIIKYEYWYHLLRSAYQKNVPIMLCSALFRSNQVFFKPYGRFFRKLLIYFDHLFVQDKASLDLLAELSMSNVTVAGDTRMDRVRDITNHTQEDHKVAQFVADKSTVMVVGSSWPEDIKVLAPLINTLDNIKFIIAPHEINESHLSQIDQVITRPVSRYTQLTDPVDAHVLVIDTIGLLSHLYQYGDYAYIGGGFGKGLHNILEAATFGLPLFFGNKNYLKFREARNLVTLKGAFAIGSSKELRTVWQRLLNDQELYDETSSICHGYVMEQTGATDVIMDYTKMKINPQ